MKKILTSVAMVLLLVGCTGKYDDSAIKTRLDAIETKLIELEGNIQSLQSAIGEGVFVAKVQEYADPDTGKIIGVTVTYTNGDVKYFEIVPKANFTAPVLGVITNGAGELVWAIDGSAIQVGGADVPVAKTPSFSIDEDGNLLVSIDGGVPENLGPVTTGGATLEDGIFTDIKVEADKIVLTLSDNSTVNIPFAAAFKLNIETTDYGYGALEAINIPYTVSAKTENTEVGVAGYDPKAFAVKVEADKIVVTPQSLTASGILLAYADSKVGLTSLVGISVEPEGLSIVDPPVSDTVDYLAESTDGSVTANVVSNIPFDVKPQVGWIKVVSVKSTASVITFSLDDNNTGAVRQGTVNITKKDKEDVIQTITIAQKAGAPAGVIDLGKKGTANCYIVETAGEYMFATVKGNSEESVGTVAKAELLWETYNNAETVTPNSVIAAVSYADGAITFSTPETIKPGNALIAAKDANDVILWSWHIWIPETSITEGTYGFMTDYQMMSRNLGALKDTEAGAPANPQSFGLLYQWGRKDPFLGAQAAGSTEKVTFAGTAMTVEEGAISQDASMAKPTVFINVDGTWCTENDNLHWGDVERDAANLKSLYDPCPPGYRVPARNKGTIFTKSGSELAGWNYDLTNLVIQVGSPVAVIPVCGYMKNDGALTASEAILWDSRNDFESLSKSYCMYISSSGSSKTQKNRAYAGSVRCMTESLPAAE